MTDQVQSGEESKSEGKRQGESTSAGKIRFLENGLADAGSERWIWEQPAMYIVIAWGYNFPRLLF
jgi:hypothetical protein